MTVLYVIVYSYMIGASGLPDIVSDTPRALAYRVTSLYDRPRPVG